MLEIIKPETKNNFVSKTNKDEDIKSSIMELEIKLAKLEIASDVLGISWINIDKNLDWFADFRLTYSWLIIFLKALEDILELINAAVLYWKEIKNTLNIPHTIMVVKNL